MKNNFWEKLKNKKPILALAPMAGFTDSAFRQICREQGADVVYSEMVSATALAYDSERTMELMEFDKKERPYVIQLFGSNPDHFAQATKIVSKKVKPDGIDINFGCPVKKVAKQGAGAVLMQDLELSKEIIKSVIDNTSLPVSIKTRTKVGKIDVLKFLDNIKDLDIKAIMIHGRTLKQGFAGEIDFEIIREARKFFDGIILANGGVNTAQDAQNLLEKTGADGVGVARGALGRPWVFKQLTKNNLQLTTKDIFKVALRHAKLAHKLKGKQGIVEMRKHLCWYVAGLPRASELRRELVKVETIKDIQNILQ